MVFQLKKPHHFPVTLPIHFGHFPHFSNVAHPFLRTAVDRLGMGQCGCCAPSVITEDITHVSSSGLGLGFITYGMCNPMICFVNIQ